MDFINRQRSFRAQAIDRIREAIVVGSLEPGAMLSEQLLADRLSISRTPVREALLELASEGLVEFVPQRGVRVLEIDAGRLAEVYQLWVAIESYSAFEAAQRPTDEMADRLQVEIDRQESIIETSGACLEWARANIDFHMLIVGALGNASMLKTIQMLTSHALRVGFRLILRTGRMRVALIDHKKIVAAFRRHDAAAARDLIIEHRDTAMVSLRRQLAQSVAAAKVSARNETDIDAKKNIA